MNYKHVKLIAMTQPVQGDPYPQDIITYCARVSNPSGQDKPTGKLLKYLVDNKHWSPLEMVNVVFEVNTTRDIARQILRHRSFHFQEFSQRYADPSQLGFENRPARLQDTKNRQNSFETDDEVLQLYWSKLQEQVKVAAVDAYDKAVHHGIAKEVARVVLPEGMTSSKLYINATLRDWYHYCQLRMGNGTQKEHREIAEEIWDILLLKFPFLHDIKDQQ